MAIVEDIEGTMIDYAEVVISLQRGKNQLAEALTKRKWEVAIMIADGLIIALVDLKWWLRKQIEDNQ
jgi:hypothetical protein